MFSYGARHTENEISLVISVLVKDEIQGEKPNAKGWIDKKSYAQNSSRILNKIKEMRFRNHGLHLRPSIPHITGTICHNITKVNMLFKIESNNYNDTIYERK